MNCQIDAAIIVVVEYNITATIIRQMVNSIKKSISLSLPEKNALKRGKKIGLFVIETYFLVGLSPE